MVSRNVISTSKKKPSHNRKGKANPATAILTKYFKMKAKADHLHWGGPSLSEKPDSKTFNEPSPDSDQTVAQNKKAATSLILFEEVSYLATLHSETCNLMGMRLHIIPVWSGLIRLQLLALTGRCYI